MCKKKLIFTSLLFCYSFFLCSQNFEHLYQKLDNDVLIFNSSKIIKQVDSLLLNSKLSDNDISEFKSLKAEACYQIASFPKALEISNEVLFSNRSFSQRAEVRLRVVRALVFEVFDQPEEALNELNILDSIYKSRKKGRHYGKYLYRKSSYFRVLRPVEKSDSLARFYADKAAEFGDTNKYYDVSAVAKMLQSFLHPQNEFEQRMEFLKASLQDLKRINDQRSMILMYNSLVRSYQKNNNILLAKKYLDSSLVLASDNNDLYLKTVVFKQKSSFLENINQNDSALFYFKKFHKVEMKMNIEKQNLEIAEINFNNQIENQNITILESNEKLEETKNNNLILIFFLSGILILLIIIYIQYRRINQKNKKIFTSNISLKKNLDEKKLLLKELNHRVKNNLALIVSLIKFQSQEIDDDFYLEKFNHLENRITTIAIAHEQFIYSEDNIEGIFYNLEEYLNKISNSLVSLSTKKIIYNQIVDKVDVTIDTALPIGILINELISNSLEHAQVTGVLKIDVSINSNKDWITILFSDSGKGFQVKENTTSLGVFIIESMVTQLQGSLDRKGASYTIKLKKK